MSRTHKRTVLEPIPVGNAVSEIILLSTYCLSRQNGGIFKIPIACFHFAGISPNQTSSGTYLTQQKKSMSSRNITKKFVAPVIALALLVIASSVGNPRGEKKFVVSTEKPASAYVCRRRIVALYAQMAREAERAHSFFRCVIDECLY